MSITSPFWNELVVAVNTYEEGDVMAVSSWIGLLKKLEPSLPQALREKARSLSSLLKEALQKGNLDGLAETVGRELDTFSITQAPVTDDLWAQHGPAFLSETRNRLARAEEIALLLEENAEPELLGELFRVFHTVKGEAGFLHRDDLSVLAHRTEELLEQVRSGREPWNSQVADLVLKGVDSLKQALASVKEHTQRSQHRQEEVLRVPASKIDALISQIGELLIAQETEGADRSSAVKKLSRALQQSALRLRTEPLNDLMNRLKRGARDLAHALGKQLEVSLAGQELELDRTLIATLEEPLMHLIRNSIDHGLEPPAARLSVDKPVEGRLGIAAERRGNRIVISIGDDGRGLDARRIWAKALEKGLVSGEQPFDPRSIYELIFRPGFSTAEQLSEVSGRGVGMDIVASSVKAARGHLDVSTEPGRGTTVAMSFPLSTAVLDALVVGLDERRFLIPVHSVLESTKIDPLQLTRLASGACVFSLRGEPLEVFSLRRMLDQKNDQTVPSWGVVTQTSKGERQVLLVDRVEAKKEVVIRTLGRMFQNLQGVSAAAILARGVPALVLDVDQLVRLAREAS